MVGMSKARVKLVRGRGDGRRETGGLSRLDFGVSSATIGGFHHGPLAGARGLMAFEQIEKLKRQYTDKYVVVDESRPELRRFKGLTGTVKTVNMSGRALVQFDGNANIGWYDIDLGSLKIIDAPLPKPEAKKEAKAEKTGQLQPRLQDRRRPRRRAARGRCSGNCQPSRLEARRLLLP